MMCLAIPFRVLEINGSEALVEHDGVRVTADTRLIDGIKPGDYILVHAGFAIQKLEPVEAEEIIGIFERLNDEI